jgi:hypothetical protein
LDTESFSDGYWWGIAPQLKFDMRSGEQVEAQVARWFPFASACQFTKQVPTNKISDRECKNISPPY